MSDPALSPLVAGCWRMADWDLSASQRLDWIRTCLDLGISSFDHADLYGDYRVEGLFGEALVREPGLRQRLQLVSKCGIRLVSGTRPTNRWKSYDTSSAHLLASVENSLRQLRTDYLDLLLIHRPDPLLDADQVAETFQRLHDEGKVRSFGASNFSPAQFALLNDRYRLASHQIECSLLHLAPLHDGSLDQAQQLRLRPMLWSPLAGGALFTGQDAAAHRVRACLDELAPELGTCPTTLAYAWLLRLPSRPHPITGSGRLEALRQAVAALDLKVPAELWHRLWSASAGREPD